MLQVSKSQIQKSFPIILSGITANNQTVIFVVMWELLCHKDQFETLPTSKSIRVSNVCKISSFI